MHKVVLLSLLLLVLALQANESEPLHFVTNEYAPYIQKDAKGNASGLIPELLNALYDKQVLSIQIVPWKRAEFMIQSGQAFAAFPYSKNASRESQFWFSEPLIDFTPKLFFLKENFPRGFSWQSFDDLREFRIVSVIGYIANSRFEQNNLNVHYVSLEYNAMHMILKDRADFTLIDERVGWHIIKSSFPNEWQEFGTAQRDDFGGTYYLMVSKKYPDALSKLAQFNQILAKFKETSEYRRIISNYQNQ